MGRRDDETSGRWDDGRAGGRDGHGIRRVTYSVPELQRLKELETEKARLKRLCAEMALENAAIKDGLSREL